MRRFALDSVLGLDARLDAMDMDRPGDVCGFRSKPATCSELMSAIVPI
jgi:hypothetical protein